MDSRRASCPGFIPSSSLRTTYIGTCYALTCSRRNMSAKDRRRYYMSPAMAISSRSRQTVPVWADGGILSSAVDALTMSPLFPVITVLARKLMISSVEKRGFDWRGHVKRMEELIPTEKRDEILRTYSDPTVVYPEYYYQGLHGYEEANLAWLPAFEAVPGTIAMSIRCYKKEPNLGCEEASDRLRSSHLDVVFENASSGFGLAENFTAVDVGCGVGMSTCSMAERLRCIRGEALGDFHVVGLDASPHMLAVANLTQKPKNVSYEHGLAETMKYGDESVDWISTQFLFHEMPVDAMRTVLEQEYRVLKRGGMFSVVDMDPSSKVVQSLPPVLFTLMKSTEPFLNGYYALDFEKLLEEVGFVNVVNVATDPRHRTIVAMK